MDLSTHPVTVIISTVSALIGVATSTWLSLIYIRKRWVGPMVEAVTNIIEAAGMVPAIRAQLFNNGGSSLRDAVDRISSRLSVIEAREKALIQEHDLGVFIADEEGKTTWVNRTYCRMFGITEDEALGFGWKNNIAPEERDAYAREWVSAVKDRREFSRIVRCFSALGGTELVFKVRAYPMDSPGSNQRGYTGFLEPVDSDTLTRVMGD